jgi:hypothetical protein
VVHQIAQHVGSHPRVGVPLCVGVPERIGEDSGGVVGQRGAVAIEVPGVEGGQGVGPGTDRPGRVCTVFGPVSHSVVTEGAAVRGGCGGGGG